MRTPGELSRMITNIFGMIISGFILALLISECREIRQTHDEVIKLDSKINENTRVIHQNDSE